MPKKRKRLNPRQANLIKELSKGKTLGQAGIAAGYTKKHPRQAAHQALEGIRKTMPQVLEAAGFTDEVLIDRYLRPLMNAHETVFAKFEGKITDSRKVIAWGPRKDGLDLAFRLKGSYAASTEEGRGPSVQVVIVDVPRPDRSKIIGVGGNGSCPTPIPDEK
jgi:hypothetical protein